MTKKEYNYLTDQQKQELYNQYNLIYFVNDIYELLYRINNNIYEAPICPVCGKKLKFLKSKKRYQYHCCRSCAAKDPNTRNKYDKTIMEKYGGYKVLYKKIEYTMIEKYGIKSALCNSSFREKGKQTKIEKYGDANFNNPEKTTETCRKNYGIGRNYNKAKETMMEKYGIDNYLISDTVNEMRNNKEIQEKISQTKRENKTFNTSKIENKTYVYLNNIFPDVIHNYKSDLYPFNCDFYIPSLDLYIECNYHWTHGFHPYQPNNENDIQKLKKWENETSQYYKNAIKTWTIRDVNKRNIAKENNLNYIEVYTIDELKKIINTLI